MSVSVDWAHAQRLPEKHAIRIPKQQILCEKTVSVSLDELLLHNSRYSSGCGDFLGI
jgi:hypothetical protein